MGFEGLKRIDMAEPQLATSWQWLGLLMPISVRRLPVNDPQALPLIKVDEPTLQMTFSVNDSPFAGQEGFCHLKAAARSPCAN